MLTIQNPTSELISSEPSPEQLESMLIPGDIPELVTRLVANRTRLSEIAPQLGLSQSYLGQLDSTTIQVGFAEQNFPAVTLFPGGVEEMKNSVRISQQIVNALIRAGYTAQLKLMLPIAYDSFVSNGYAACDYLLLPKNETQNKKVPLFGGKTQRSQVRNQAYASLEISEAQLGEIKKQIKDSCMSSRKFIQPNANGHIIKTDRLIRSQILEAIFQDLDTAFACCGGSYYEFIMQLNLLFTERLFGIKIPSESVDNVMNSFLVNGISDLNRFFTQLASLGLDISQPVLKAINNKGEMISIYVGIVNGEVLAGSTTTGILPLRKLLDSIPVFPKKELAYFIEMAGLVPQMYLDDNQKIYEPYFDTMELLNRLGLQPVMFPYRDRLALDISESVTMIDFYGYMLLTQES